MGAHKHEEHEEHEGGHDEPWLVSYADMMTLLFGFFVLMYSFASKEKQDQWEKVRKDVAKYFGGEYVTPYDDLVKQIERAIENTPLAKEIDKKVTPEGLEITFRSTVLFESGKATIQPIMIDPMNRLASVIIERKNDVGMSVEGHTDDVPIATEKFPSNWELSGARATTVVRIFEKLGFPVTSMWAVAHGETMPVYPNRNEAGEIIPDNQARNRRVVIKVFSKAKLLKENPQSPTAHDVHGSAPPGDATAANDVSHGDPAAAGADPHVADTADPHAATADAHGSATDTHDATDARAETAASSQTPPPASSQPAVAAAPEAPPAEEHRGEVKPRPLFLPPQPKAHAPASVPATAPNRQMNPPPARPE